MCLFHAVSDQNVDLAVLETALDMKADQVAAFL
jgi:hypothetical protein